MTTGETLTKLFWHRGRRQFVELTATDAARRLCTSEARAGSKLMTLAADGYAEYNWHKLNSDIIMIWRVTGMGRNMIVAHLDG